MDGVLQLLLCSGSWAGENLREAFTENQFQEVQRATLTLLSSITHLRRKTALGLRVEG